MDTALSPAFTSVLEATGYIEAGRHAEGLVTAGAIETAPEYARYEPIFSSNRGGLAAAAVFRSREGAFAYFKDATGQAAPSAGELTGWHTAAWNFGLAPLLWIVSPTRIWLFDAYSPPPRQGTADQSAILREFDLTSNGAEQLRILNELCGRLAADTGSFWRSDLAPRIDRSKRVDRTLLKELAALEKALVANDLDLPTAQKLIGRCIFVQYLAHRGLLTPGMFESKFAALSLADALKSKQATYKIFDWLHDTFNGDLFPAENPEREQRRVAQHHLSALQCFFSGLSLISGQGNLFPFRFDAIPVELISSIYEQFAHSAAKGEARAQGIHYTPLSLVELILDPVFDGLSERARILDCACGSGVFLVESLRRLVWKRVRTEQRTRKLVRDVLYKQLFGIDSNPAALRIAAFSLYLAALEMDPEPPGDLRQLKFKKLIGESLFEQSGFDEGPLSGKEFDAIVGNPPWTYVRANDSYTAGQKTGDQYTKERNLPTPPRSPDWAFLWRTIDFSSPKTRIGLVMKATPFFSQMPSVVAARKAVFGRFSPVTVVNFAPLRLEDLFPQALFDGDGEYSKKVTGPAIVFLGRCGLVQEENSLTVLTVPWTASFKRTGIFEIGPEHLRHLSLSRIDNCPAVLKTAAYGTMRDVWLIERLSRDNSSLIPLREWIQRIGARLKQGIQPAARSKHPVGSFAGKKFLNGAGFCPFRLDTAALRRLEAKYLYRSYNPKDFRGPLVICPEGKFARSLEAGRYSTAFHPADLLFSESYLGISFHGLDLKWARALNAVLNSAMTSYQLVYTASVIGVKQTKVEVVDLENIQLPPIDTTSEGHLNRLLEAERSIAESRGKDVRELLRKLDELVFDLYDLSDGERTLVKDGLSRGRPFVFESDKERRRTVASPSSEELKLYAAEVIGVVNGYLAARGKRRLSADVLGTLGAGSRVIRFVIEEKTVPGQVMDMSGGDLGKLLHSIQNELGGAATPYLHERRSLRIYSGTQLYLIKPNERRYWTKSAGLNDGDAILADHSDRLNW